MLDNWTGGYATTISRDWGALFPCHLETANVACADGCGIAMRVEKFYGPTADVTWLNLAMGGS